VPAAAEEEVGTTTIATETKSTTTIATTAETGGPLQIIEVVEETTDHGEIDPALALARRAAGEIFL
jgi:hypothetical protein